MNKHTKEDILINGREGWTLSLFSLENNMKEISKIPPEGIVTLIEEVMLESGFGKYYLVLTSKNELGLITDLAYSSLVQLEDYKQSKNV